MDTRAIRSEVIAALRGATPIRAPLDDGGVTSDTLIGDGGFCVDSLALLHAFVALEARFGIVFDDHSVASARFDTVGSLERLVRGALDRGGTAGADARDI